MSKKVLIISSTPRIGGNSDILCDQFLLGAQEAGHHVKKIALREKQIHYCTGCGACMVNGGHCVQKDDMEAVLKQMISADVIVIATPVYFYTMCAQLKTLIDRTVPRYTEISKKDFYFIATAAVHDPNLLERAFDGIRGFLDCLDGATEKGFVYGTGAWAKGEIKCSPSMQQAYEMGKSIR